MHDLLDHMHHAIRYVHVHCMHDAMGSPAHHQGQFPWVCWLAFCYAELCLLDWSRKGSKQQYGCMPYGTLLATSYDGVLSVLAGKEGHDEQETTGYDQYQRTLIDGDVKERIVFGRVRHK